MLVVENLNTYIGKSHILFNISLEVNKGAIVALAGRNGVGKTTTLNSIMGITPPKSGKVLLEMKDITRIPPHQRFCQGMGYVPSGKDIFSSLSVEENLMIGHPSEDILSEIFNHFPYLKGRRKQIAGTLSGGERKMLAIARALCGQPKLLLLDEPTEGLMPILRVELKKIIKILNQRGITTLLVEQDIDMIMEICSKIYIMEKGEMSYTGTVEELSKDKSVIEKYLGVDV
jgi:branched-chain amino acid transport system ATP-binding protein